MSDTTERGPTSGLLREFATALDKDRGHSRSMVTRVMRDAADDIDALAAELAAAEKERDEANERSLAELRETVALEKRNEELEAALRRYAEEAPDWLKPIARRALAAASEGKP